MGYNEISYLAPFVRRVHFRSTKTKLRSHLYEGELLILVLVTCGLCERRLRNKLTIVEYFGFINITAAALRALKMAIAREMLV